MRSRIQNKFLHRHFQATQLLICIFTIKQRHKIMIKDGKSTYGRWKAKDIIENKKRILQLIRNSILRRYCLSWKNLSYEKLFQVNVFLHGFALLQLAWDLNKSYEELYSRKWPEDRVHKRIRATLYMRNVTWYFCGTVHCVVAVPYKYLLSIGVVFWMKCYFTHLDLYSSKKCLRI